MVTPPVVTGQPAQIARLPRDIVAGGAFGNAAAHIDVFDFARDRCRPWRWRCLTAWPPITAPWVWLKPPRTDLARPVRAVETMTASFMASSGFWPRGD